MPRQKKSMNPKKRKAEEDEDFGDLTPEESVDNESGTSSEKGECGDSTDQQKSENGGSSERASTSDNKKSENGAKDFDEGEKKLTKLEGSKNSGTLLFCGGTNWDLTGRKQLPKNAKDATGENLWGPHTLASLKGIKVVSAHAGCCAVHSVIITDKGQAYSWGRNDKGQLGLSDTKRRDVPTRVEALKDHYIISASCGRGHTLFLTDRGEAYSCGDNKMGQCGTGSKNTPTITVPTKVSFKARSIVKVACGGEFSVIVDIHGGLHSFGSSEYGQLGHNSDGSYIATGNKLAFDCEYVPKRVIAFIEKNSERQVTLIDDVQIANVACGANHTVAVDSKGRCFSFGFGGYGRLGHAEQKDEMVPRLIKVLRGVKSVYSGSSFSMAVNVHEALYFWGLAKKSGEATMYPKPVQDLIGWKIRDLACANTSIMCVADDSVISWGPSPTYGELGYGESRAKSSTTAQEVKPLKGIHIYSVAMGYGHSLLIARNESEEDAEKIEQLPEHAP